MNCCVTHAAKPAGSWPQAASLSSTSGKDAFDFLRPIVLTILMVVTSFPALLLHTQGTRQPAVQAARSPALVNAAEVPMPVTARKVGIQPASGDATAVSVIDIRGNPTPFHQPAAGSMAPLIFI